jgi:uncharacterized YigZ family protein
MGYWTISAEAEGYYEVKGSKFFAYAAPVSDEEAVKQWISQKWKEHPKAHHVCFAFRMGVRQIQTKTDDNGEPANTAGQPILNHLEGQNLTNIVLAVVRYFGGVKLGKGGLISAYGYSAKIALNQATVTWQVETRHLQATIAYKNYAPFMEKLKKAGVHIVNEEYFSDNCRFTIEIPFEETHHWERWLSNNK